MAIVSRTNVKPTIDLKSSEGNAFYLINQVKVLGNQLGWTKEKIESVRKEMMSGDNKNLITIFDKNFGDYVDLVE